ncbi:putative F420-dependent oxidoreductase [Sinobacterium caligoides]|uniref:Putative F420-dependent oxidoreductase n=1 Tax=Sinobacterium caligoides TaxID=933926 RepID=A0A3N2DZ84_9GAMM|nr:TIGR03617 family F420-dependent LLM class oxidoreductase [Sinobacterium caligoides]ROS04769.1 putative F420-dependent oxidoreductase [Sinobacterium caligoides]
MKIDGPFYATVENAASEAKRLQEAGYDGVYTLEGNTDPFFPLLLAAEHAPGMDIATAIAVAFPRNPAHLAYQAWDLQTMSKGRFSLGLGSQVKAHVERRFGCEFSQPARRMREQILAIKAFFDCFQQGSPLNFDGEFYQHTLMTPMFDAKPNRYGVPNIMLGALGPLMTKVAAEVADGLILHPFNTESFIRERQLSVIDKQLRAQEKERSSFTVSATAICVTGNNEEEYRAAEQSVKGLLAFYASTKAYLPPMEALGYAELQPELNRLTREGRWSEMAALIDDDFLQAFAVCDEPRNMAKRLKQRYGGFSDRLGIYAPYMTMPDVWPGIVASLKGVG